MGKSLKKIAFGLSAIIVMVGCQSKDLALEEEVLTQETEGGLTTNPEDIKLTYPEVTYESVAIEIADELYNVNSEVRDWVDSVKDQKGYYVRQTEESDLVLLAGGKQSLTGYGMVFVDARQSEDGIHLIYSISAPSVESIEAGQVMEQETYPFMLLNLPKQEGSIYAQYIEEDEIGVYMTQLHLFGSELEPEVTEDILAQGPVEEVLSPEASVE